MNQSQKLLELNCFPHALCNDVQGEIAAMPVMTLYSTFSAVAHECGLQVI